MLPVLAQFDQLTPVPHDAQSSVPEEVLQVNSRSRLVCIIRKPCTIEIPSDCSLLGFFFFFWSLGG
jgi:hypothetical protein